MRGLGASFLARRARSSWLLLACVAVTVLLVTGLAAVLWSFASGVVPSGALTTLASPQTRSVALTGPVNAGQATSDTRDIRDTLRTAWPGVGFQMESALWAEAVVLPSSGALPPVAGGFTVSAPTSQVEVASLPGLAAQATLTAGTWPGPPEHGDPVPAALPAAAASQLHVSVGSVLRGTLQFDSTAESLRVTGLYRPDNPSSAYWSLDILPTSGVSTQGSSHAFGGFIVQSSTVSYGPAIVNPAAFGGTLTVNRASWVVVPRAADLSGGNLPALATGTSGAVSQLTTLLPNGLQVSTSLPQTLSGLVSTAVLTQSLFTIAALELLLIAGAGLVLAARLLASLREEESALLRARGATRWQLARPALAEAAVLGVAASVIGVLAGTRLTGVVAGLGNLHLNGYTTRVTPLAWLSALATLVVCVAVLAWPALHVLDPGAARRRRGREARLAGIALAGGDLALVALAAVAVWQLHGYSAVAHTASGSLGIDPVVAIAPALALAGMALIPVRGLPVLARLADQATDRERRLAAAMVSWQIARRPIRQTGPALLVVLATAITTLALAGYASWHQSAADQAAFSVGSDVQVNSDGPLPLGETQEITRAPGVTAATAASVTQLGGGAQLIALDASTADKGILLRSDLSSVPVKELWQSITPSRLPGLTLPAEIDRLEVLASLAVTPASSASTLGPVSATAVIQDASGATYQIPASGILPTDDRTHSLVFTLTNSRRADYPLRLLGFQLGFLLPPYDTKNPSFTPTALLTIESLAAADTDSGPFRAPFSDGAPLAGWPASAGSSSVPTGPPDEYDQLPPSDGEKPAPVRWHAVGGSAQLTFSTGHVQSEQVILVFGNGTGGYGSETGEVAISAPSPTGVVPAIATAGYLTANHLSVGSTTSANGITVEIVASVARFPTVFGSNEALIVDAALASGSGGFPVTRWWLRTTAGQVPKLPAGLGLSVTSRASEQSALTSNLLLTAPRQGTLAVGLAAVLLGMLGFSISVAASLRSRRTQSAVFAAMGVGKVAQAGQLCLEQCAISIPAAAAGLLAGIGLAELMVPGLTLTTNATVPVPSVLVVVPIGLAVALALITVAVPVAAAALTVAHRPDPAAQLRVEAL